MHLLTSEQSIVFVLQLLAVRAPPRPVHYAGYDTWSPHGEEASYGIGTSQFILPHKGATMQNTALCCSYGKSALCRGLPHGTVAQVATER